MAQSIFLPPQVYINPASVPSSPDPTPLRMLAFSVAEAALQSSPNSPMFGQVGKVPSPPKVLSAYAAPAPAQAPARAQGVNARWTSFDDGKRGNFTPPAHGKGESIAQRRGKDLWNVAERAKDRRTNPAFIIDSAAVGPLSPSYTFNLPPNSPLAESIAADANSPVGTKPRRAALAALSTLSISPQHPALYTRSAEPSPIYSTFSGLDQSRPPPEFVPRLTAQEFSIKSSKIAATTKARHARTQSDADSPDLVSPVGAVFPAQPKLPGRPSRHTQRLPSLQQIQAKMKRAHRRAGSVGEASMALHAATADDAEARSASVAIPRPMSMRTDSEDSIVLQTPDEDVPNPLRDRRLALAAIMGRRPSTPPSPSGKERLLPFLRERTSDRRLAAVKGDVVSDGSPKPSLRVIPPTLDTRPAIPPLVLAPEALSPTRPGFIRRTTSPIQRHFTPPPRLATPPAIRAVSAAASYQYGTGSAPRTPTSSSTPISPTSSVSRSATGSPTMNMPIITCTPAPAVVLRDGVEHESDDEADSQPDVVVFDGEAEEREREERERRGIEMRAKLGLRRRSID